MVQPKTASDLYGLPLDQFTPERNELVKHLKAEGEKEEAARVGKLRKPSIAAWAVNQLVRTQAKAVRALFEAGDAVANAQGQGQADTLREAAAELRAELARLTSRAEGLLDSEGSSLAPNVLERVGETLRAAAIDPESRAQVKDGCLTRELQFTGLGGFAAPAPAPSQNRKAGAEATRRQREQVKLARQQERQARQDLQAAEKELRQAERARQKAAGRVSAAEEALAQASEALTLASQELDELQRGGR